MYAVGLSFRISLFVPSPLGLCFRTSPSQGPLECTLLGLGAREEFVTEKTAFFFFPISIPRAAGPSLRPTQPKNSNRLVPPRPWPVATCRGHHAPASGVRGVPTGGGARGPGRRSAARLQLPPLRARRLRGPLPRAPPAPPLPPPPTPAPPPRRLHALRAHLVPPLGLRGPPRPGPPPRPPPRRPRPRQLSAPSLPTSTRPLSGPRTPPVRRNARAHRVLLQHPYLALALA